MEKNKTIASPRQKKAAKAVLQNLAKDNPASLGQVLKNVGYGKGLQLQPKRVLESKGFKIALAELGLTEELITESLVEDIRKKPQNRVQEMKLGAEILGMVKREDPEDKPRVNNTYNFLFNTETQAEIKRVEEIIKAKLINPDAKTN